MLGWGQQAAGVEASHLLSTTINACPSWANKPGELSLPVALGRHPFK